MPTATDNAVLQAALDYADTYGWRVVALYPRTKKPIGESWQHANATTDVEKIEAKWSEFPAANVGVQLGPGSNLIDAECDDEEQEQALARLFGGEFPETPTFSADRGKHRLFRFRTDFPEAGAKGILYVNGVGFRTGGGGKAAQSVFPPSIHPSGKQYRWLIHPEQCPVAEIPDEVMARIWEATGEAATVSNAKPIEHWQAVSDGVSEGGRNETAASFIGRVLRCMRDVFNIDDIQIQWDFIQDWNERNNPPLPKAELESVFRSILQRERHRRTNDETATEILPQRAWSPDSGSIAAPEWRLVIREENPRVYKLWSPLWSIKAPLGYIVLGTADMLNWELIRKQALEQADVWLNRNLAKVWNGDKESESLARRLVETATFEKAPIESRRDLVAAEMLYEQVSRARVLGDGQEPDNLRMCRTQSGELMFKFFKILEPMSMSAQKVTREELSKTLTMIGATDAVIGARGQRRRFKVISPDAESRLRSLIAIGDE